MKNTPEWFIGGPLHGKDRRNIFPRDQFGPFQVPESINDALADNYQETRFWYHRQRFTIGNRVIVFWWGYDTSQEVAASMLADLLLAPHEFETERRTESDNTGDSDRWEDPRDTFGGETDNETGKEGEPA